MPTKLDSLHKLFVMELQDIFDAEQQILKALPKMAEKATNAALRDAFTSHITETEGQIERLDEIFERLDLDAKPKTCKGMKGLIAEGEEFVKAGGDEAAIDAALISAAQRVEHYEMAAYGSLRTFARLMGMTEVADLLQESLDEEGAADKKLTAIAEDKVNRRAA